jgi:Fe-S-cluster formation regulator IscX/YfhJ
MPNGPIGKAIEQMVKHLRDTSYLFYSSELRRFEQTEYDKQKADILNICDQLDSLAETVDQSDIRFSVIEDYLHRLAEFASYPLPDDKQLVSQKFFDAKRLDPK